MTRSIKRLRATSLALGLLILMNAGLLAIGLQISNNSVADISSREPSAPPSADSVASDEPESQAFGMDADDPIVARPTFLASRRPFVAPPSPAQLSSAREPVQPIVEPAIIVSGIVIGTSLRKAHLSHGAEASGQWYEIGQAVEGWTLTDIQADKVSFAQADRRFSVSLYPPSPQAFSLEPAFFGRRSTP